MDQFPNRCTAGLPVVLDADPKRRKVGGIGFQILEASYKLAAGFKARIRIKDKGEAFLDMNECKLCSLSYLSYFSKNTLQYIKQT